MTWRSVTVMTLMMTHRVLSHSPLSIHTRRYEGLSLRVERLFWRFIWFEFFTSYVKFKSDWQFERLFVLRWNCSCRLGGSNILSRVNVNWQFSSFIAMWHSFRSALRATTSRVSRVKFSYHSLNQQNIENSITECEVNESLFTIIRHEDRHKTNTNDRICQQFQPS